MTVGFDPSLTIGIEEEYLLVDPETRDLAAEPPAELIPECEKALGPHVTPEFLRSQIEIGTPVCRSIKEARRELCRLRRGVVAVAEAHGLKLIAASTHPFAQWRQQVHTPKERYDKLARDMQGAIRQMLICGMHVHVGIEDDDLRVDVMNQVAYVLPHLLALSTSSPFWQGERMGLKSFRLSVFDGMPRTGMPDQFDSFGEYERLVERMVDTGLLEDSTKIWWDIRPSAKFPTLEMRIADVCTRLEDALAIAALYQCFVRMLVRLRRSNQKWRVYPRTLLHENRWLAQRFGVAAELVDLGKGVRVPVRELIYEMIHYVREDAEALDCVAEVEHARTIVDRGASADHQLKAYDRARQAGADDAEALKAVVDHLVAQTVRDLPDC